MADPLIETSLRLLEIVSIVGGGALVAFRLGRSTQRMDAAIEAQKFVADNQNTAIRELKAEVLKLGEILTKLAVQDTRINNIADRVALLDARYEEIRHGEGFVMPLVRPHP